MSTSATVAFKLKRGATSVHRFSFERTPTYDEFLAKLRRLFPSDDVGGALVVQYRDDEQDVVTVASAEEFGELLRVFRHESLVRVELNERAVNKRQEAAQQQQQQQQQQQHQDAPAHPCRGRWPYRAQQQQRCGGGNHTTTTNNVVAACRAYRTAGEREVECNRALFEHLARLVPTAIGAQMRRTPGGPWSWDALPVWLRAAVVRRGDELDVNVDKLRSLLHARAHSLIGAGEHASAIAILTTLLLLSDADTIAHYNLACALALHGEPERALRHLRSAVEHGYADLEHLESDEDLASLRDSDEYRGVCSLLRARGGSRQSNDNDSDNDNSDDDDDDDSDDDDDADDADESDDVGRGRAALAAANPSSSSSSSSDDDAQISSFVHVSTSNVDAAARVPDVHVDADADADADADSSSSSPPLLDFSLSDTEPSSTSTATTSTSSSSTATSIASTTTTSAAAQPEPTVAPVPPPAAEPTVSDELRTLIEMGFSVSSARQVLAANNNNVEQSIGVLLSM